MEDPIVWSSYEYVHELQTPLLSCRTTDTHTEYLPVEDPSFFFFFKENTLQFPRMLTFHVMQFERFCPQSSAFLYARVATFQLQG